MADALSALLLDDRTPTPQIQGPQPGRVLGVDGAKLLVSLELFPDQEFACTWGKDAAHNHTTDTGTTGFAEGTVPPAGTRCLVLFAGTGIADPWIVAFANWPS